MELYEGAPYRINIIGADSTMMVDSYNRTVMANIVNSDGELLIDQDLGEYLGNVKGHVLGVHGKKIIDIETYHIDANTIRANIVNEKGDIVYDTDTNIIKCDVVGDIYNNNGDILTDISNNTWLGNVKGSILDREGNVVFDNEIGAIKKDVIGNVYTSDGLLSYDHNTGVFTGKFVGDFTDRNGETVYNAETNTFQGTFFGNLLGNIVDSTGNVFIDVEHKTIDSLQGDFTGSFYGDILNKIGNSMYNLDNDELSVSVVSADEVVAKKISGVFAGDICDPTTNELLFDSEQRMLHNVDLKGNIYNDNGIEIYNAKSNSISVSNLFTEQLSGECLELPNANFDHNGLKIEIDKVFSEPAIELRYFREFEPPVRDWLQIGMELCLSGGTQTDPVPVKPGQKLPGLVYSAIIDTNANPNDSTAIHMGGDLFKTKSYVAAIYARIPEDADVRPDLKEAGCPGDLYFVTGGYEEQANYMIYDNHGKLHVTLAEINTDGETGVEPSNTTAPDSWLQITVNGEPKFLPLYS